jgi:hypothetical protein
MYHTWQACLVAADELVRVMDASAWCEYVKT